MKKLSWILWVALIVGLFAAVPEAQAGPQKHKHHRWHHHRHHHHHWHPRHHKVVVLK